MLMIQHVARHAVQSPDPPGPGQHFLRFNYTVHMLQDIGSRIVLRRDIYIFWGGRNYVDNWYAGKILVDGDDCILVTKQRSIGYS